MQVDQELGMGENKNLLRNVVNWMSRLSLKLKQVAIDKNTNLKPTTHAGNE